MNYNINHKQAGTQDDSNARAQLTASSGSCPKDASPNIQMSQHIKCVSPMTFSQKLYQSHALEIAEEFEQAIDANSLEKIKKILDKVLES